MNSKLPILLAALVIVTMGYGLCMSFHQAPSISQLTTIPNQSSSVRPQSITDSLGQDREVVTPISQGDELDEANKITYAEFQKRYAVPDTELAVFIKRMLEQEKTDNTGISSFLIFKILYRCSLGPLSKMDLEELNHIVAERVQVHGGSNGEVLESLKRPAKMFNECQEVNKLLPVGQYNHYLQMAVDLNNPAAQYVIARMIPNDYLEWDESRKQQHREEMGKFLEQSQHQCEPAAFNAMANPQAFGEGEQWVIVSDASIPPQIRAFGNLIAETFFYANSVINANEKYDELMLDVKERASVMGAYEIEQAKQYGEALYTKYCLGENQ